MSELVFVGATTAQRLAEKALGDVVLHDIVEGMPKARRLDMLQSACIEGFDSDVKGTNDPADYAGSDIVIITSGLARQPGMSRDDLLAKNAQIVGGVAENVKKFAPESIVIVVSNPLDVMTYLVAAKTGFPKERVMGHGRRAGFRAVPLLHRDGARRFLPRCGRDGAGRAWRRHGARWPLLHRVRHRGSKRFCRRKRSDAMVARTRNGGAEIVKLLQKGSAYYAALRGGRADGAEHPA